MMTALTAVHEHVKDLHGDLVRAARRRDGRPRLVSTRDAAGAPPCDDARTTCSSCGRPRACAARPRLPGDKSISHRALLLALLAEGESRIEAAGDGEDVRSTAGLVAALGATVERVARA